MAKPETRHFLGCTLRKIDADIVQVLVSKRSIDRIDEQIRELLVRRLCPSLR